MDYNFSNTEILFIYGHFKKQIEILKKIQSGDVKVSSIKQDLGLYTSILQKIEVKHPNFSELPL